MAGYLIETTVPELEGLAFRYTGADDPHAQHMLTDLQTEYDRLYESQAKAAETDKEINAYPAEAFTGEHGGAFVLLMSGETAVAGGAIMACRDPLAEKNSAEFKRIWTNPRYRGLGLSKILLNELEFEAVRLGYTSIFLTTGDNQPRAVSLYSSVGYQHLEVDDTRGHIYHAFIKPLAEHIAQHRISPRVRGQLETNTAESYQ